MSIVLVGVAQLLTECLILPIAPIIVDGDPPSPEGFASRERFKLAFAIAMFRFGANLQVEEVVMVSFLEPFRAFSGIKV